MRWLRRTVEFLLALLILFEEWGWEPLQAALARLGRLAPLAWIEGRLAALSPYAALAVFGLPALTLLPLKLMALWLVGAGHAALGILLIVAAKLVGTAFMARLFTLTRPALMRLGWFATLHTRWRSWKAALLERVYATAAWRRVRAVSRRLSRRWKRWRAG